MIYLKVKYYNTNKDIEIRKNNLIEQHINNL